MDARGDNSDSHRNSPSFPGNPALSNDRNFNARRGGFSGEYDHRHRPHNRPDQRNNSNFNTEHNPGGGSNGSHQSSSTPWRKRPFSHSGPGSSQDCPEGGSYVKLYVKNVPRDTSEDEIRSLFMEYGEVVEVIILRDKMTGQQQEYCFVKYGKVEDGNQAIASLDCNYTFVGGVLPIKVRYAEGERDRLGALSQKLFVGCLNRNATKEEIHEVFSPYGRIVEVYVVLDEMKQSRGCGFVHYVNREMAVAAMNALNGNFTMKGCDQPLIVRFADPKKPRIGEPRPPPYFNDQGRPMPPVASNQFGPNTTTSSLQQPRQIKQHSVSSTCTSPGPGFLTSSSVTTVPTQTRDHPLECDWSEHICPDGYMYYYNCVTCESLWEKPGEYSRYEQQTVHVPQQLTSSQEVYPLVKPPFISTGEFSQMQQERNGLQVQARKSPIVGPTCV